MDSRPIGIFDSGVGGLTVVKQILKVMPNEQIVYFGDTARVPYGDKSKETVTKFSRQDIGFLLSKNVKAVVIACNTSSSNCLDILKNEFDIPIFGVVEPGVTEAIKSTKNKKIGVIATEATVRSKAYESLLCSADPKMQVFSKACPLFVPLAEEGWTYNEISMLTAEKYLKELMDNGIDSLVLGCTHYPLLKKCIGETVGDAIKLVDPARETARCVKNFLKDKDMLREEETQPSREFYLSDVTNKFHKICEKALKADYEPKEIDIEKF